MLSDARQRGAEAIVAAEAHLDPQFDSAPQQRLAAHFGLWVFLASEVMFFGGLFLAYLVYRHLHYAAFVAGSRSLNLAIGTANTLILIASSFTMALAVRVARLGDNRQLRRFLAITMLLGALFLSLKGWEYWQHIQEHHLPGAAFQFDFHRYGAGHRVHAAGGEPAAGPRKQTSAKFRRAEWKIGRGGLILSTEMSAATEQSGPGALAPAGLPTVAAAAPRPASASSPPAERPGPRLLTLARERQVELFMFLYFVMTGLHATHMLVGLGLLLWLWLQARNEIFSVAWHHPVENIGLYWHFVDIIWIYLYPLLYLINRFKT